MHVFVRVFIAESRRHDHTNFYKGKHLILVAHIQFTGLVPYYHGGTWWREASMVLKNCHES